jgi:predicted nucleotidyltransferase
MREIQKGDYSRKNTLPREHTKFGQSGVTDQNTLPAKATQPTNKATSRKTKKNKGEREAHNHKILRGTEIAHEKSQRKADHQMEYVSAQG